MPKCLHLDCPHWEKAHANTHHECPVAPKEAPIKECFFEPREYRECAWFWRTECRREREKNKYLRKKLLKQSMGGERGSRPIKLRR